MTNENIILGFGRRVARKLGLKRRKEWGIRVQRDAALTKKLLAECLRKDSNCVDIGANKGDFLDDFTGLAPNGKHIAFEPIPAHAQALAERFTDVDVHSCALSDHDGEATFFHVENRDAWSGLQKQRYPDGAVPTEITVELKRLDDVIGSERAVDFVKIDVEGAEYEVLKGARETLLRCKPVLLFEHAKLHNENYDTTAEMMYDLLAGDYGMGIFDLTRTQQFDRTSFIAIYESSAASNYDRNAQTNFVAQYP